MNQTNNDHEQLVKIKIHSDESWEGDDVSSI